MKKILLVDDVKLFLSMEQSCLARENLQIFTATSGKEAIEILRREIVDLMLLDLYMPDMNGDEVCKLIRNDSNLKSVSIIMVTTSYKDDDIKKCIAAGANDYIAKPINATELLKKVGKYIEVPHRKDLRVLSRIEIKAQRGNKEFLAHTVNISTSGMLVESKEDISIGDIMTASLFLPGGFTSVSMTGTVVRKIDNGAGKLPYYGVKFLNVAERDAKIIEKHVIEQGKRGMI